MELAKALVKFQSVVPVIPKNQTAKIPMKAGGSYSYKYADLADIWEAIRKPLKECGLAVTQMLGELNGDDVIYTKIWHESGEVEEKPFRIPTNGKTPQEVGSVVTYYKRYALGAALGISTEEDDDGKAGNSVPVAKESESTVLARAKTAINKELAAKGYDTAPAKIAFVTSVLEHPTINNLNDADAIADALENEA